MNHQLEPTGDVRPAEDLESDPVFVRRVGPGQPGAATGQFSTGIAADSYFTASLVTLWHKVSQAGGAVGFTEQVTRAQVAKLAARTVQNVRDGLVHGLALTQGRALIGVAFLEPGREGEVNAHTATISRVMVDADRQGKGLGSSIMDAALGLARDLGLERVSVTVRDGFGLESFYVKRGFSEAGRRPAWLRQGPGDDRDEIIMWRQV